MRRSGHHRTGDRPRPVVPWYETDCEARTHSGSIETNTEPILAVTSYVMRRWSQRVATTLYRGRIRVRDLPHRAPRAPRFGSNPRWQAAIAWAYSIHSWM